MTFNKTSHPVVQNNNCSGQLDNWLFWTTAQQGKLIISFPCWARNFLSLLNLPNAQRTRQVTPRQTVIGLPSKMWEPQFKFLLFFPPHLTTFCARWSEHCNPIIHNTRRAKTYTNEGTELKSTHFNDYSP